MRNTAVRDRRSGKTNSVTNKLLKSALRPDTPMHINQGRKIEHAEEPEEVFKPVF